jgi:dipeptidyl aminopeptidase/acylaminoacyl peptidase
MRATDIPLLRSLSAPTVHPAGERVVVAVTRADLDADAYVGQLWEAPLDGSAPPRRLTRGFRDTQPRFSPDGAMLAFLRAEPAKPPQLMVVDARGGEPVALTDARLGVESFRFSPDSRAIAFSTRDPEHGRYGSVEGIDAASEPPRRVTTMRYRSNGLGYTIDRRSRIRLVSVPALDDEPVVQPVPSATDDEHGPATRPSVPQSRVLTPADADHGPFAFSPDGSEVYVAAALHDTADTDLRSGLYAFSTLENPTTEPRVIVQPEHGLAIEDVTIAFGSDIVLIAQEMGESGRDFVARNAGLWLVETAGPRRLTDAETIDLGEAGSAAVAHGDRVLVQNRTRGSVELLAVSRSGALERLVTGPVEVTGVASGGEDIVVSYRDGQTAGELGRVGEKELEPRSDFSADVRASGIRSMQEMTVTGRDGHPIHGWVATPEGDGPFPVLLNIHGGPFAQYSSSLFDETQVYVDAGYAVVMCNPRGSAGYGQAHGRAIRGAMGTLDLHDVLDFLDGAIEADASLDAMRTGILGGSYGGYLTAWVIAHDHRFAAAIVERGFLDPEYFIGTSDIGDFFSDEYTGSDVERRREQSPQHVVDRVSTPTLVLHSEEDLRCPISQAERYYAALKRRGVPTELLVFPGEDHELSRSGRPRHRVQRFEAILEWWQRYLPVGSPEA